MGAPSAQVQSSQSSTPASKSAGISPSTPAPAGKGTASMSATSGQPTMGQANPNGNTGLPPIDPNLVAPQDPMYANTTGAISKNSINNTDGQPIGKMGGNASVAGKSSLGKGSQNVAEPQKIEF